MAAALRDISVDIGARRRACVLDPTLALSPLGPSLVRRLCRGMKIWLVREPWHILDDCDLLIGEVICGSPLIERRPFGSIGAVQRLGLDLRYALDRSTYGNIFALTETGHYLKTVLRALDAPDIKKGLRCQYRMGCERGRLQLCVVCCVR